MNTVSISMASKPGVLIQNHLLKTINSRQKDSNLGSRQYVEKGMTPIHGMSMAYTVGNQSIQVTW